MVPVRDQDGVDGGLVGAADERRKWPPAAAAAPMDAVTRAPSSSISTVECPSQRTSTGASRRRRGRAVARRARVVRKVEPDAPGCSTAVGRRRTSTPNASTTAAAIINGTRVVWTVGDQIKRMAKSAASTEGDLGPCEVRRELGPSGRGAPAGAEIRRPR